MAEAGCTTNCIVLRAASTGAQLYVIPLGKASAVESREKARHKIIGSLPKAEFLAKVRQPYNSALVPFDPERTTF